MGIAMVWEVWVILPGIRERGAGYRAVLSLGTVRRFFLGLPEVTVCVFPGLLFSSLSMPLLGGFCWGVRVCLIGPGHRLWGMEKNTSRCVRKLVHNSGVTFLCGVMGGV